MEDFSSYFTESSSIVSKQKGGWDTNQGIISSEEAYEHFNHYYDTLYRGKNNRIAREKAKREDRRYIKKPSIYSQSLYR